MADIALSGNGMLTTRSGRDSALEAALECLAPGRLPEGPDTLWGNLHVTAVRRLAAVAAEHAPFPPSLDRRLRAALESRGILELYTHQTEAIEHALGGGNIVVTTPTA